MIKETIINGNLSFFSLKKEDASVPPIIEFLDDLKKSRELDFKKIFKRIERFSQTGFIPNNSENFSHEGDQIYAIKAHQIRLYGFFFNGGKEFILTNGCIKKRDKAKPEDLRKAKDWRYEYMKGAQHHE